MADKLQLKTKFSYGSVTTSKTLDIPKTTATDDQLRAFSAKYGSFVQDYVLVSNDKVETTSLDNA